MRFLHFTRIVGALETQRPHSMGRALNDMFTPHPEPRPSGRALKIKSSVKEDPMTRRISIRCLPLIRAVTAERHQLSCPRVALAGSMSRMPPNHLGKKSQRFHRVATSGVFPGMKAPTTGISQVRLTIRPTTRIGCCTWCCCLRTYPHHAPAIGAVRSRGDRLSGFEERELRSEGGRLRIGNPPLLRECTMRSTRQRQSAVRWSHRLSA